MTIEGLGGACLDWHPDGNLLATGGFEGEVYIWDSTQHTSVSAMPHQDRVTAVRWHPGGELLATTSDDGTAVLARWPPGDVVAAVESNVSLGSICWDHGGQTLALGGWDNEVYLWRPFDPANASGASQLVQLSGHTAALHDIAWSPDGTRLVTTSGDGTARIWDVAEHRESAQLPAGEAFVVDWSTDGRFIATGSRDGTARIWDAPTGELVQELIHPEAVRALAWSPDGKRMLTGGERGGVWVWQVGLDHLRRELVEFAADLMTDDAIRELIPHWPNRTQPHPPLHLSSTTET